MTMNTQCKLYIDFTWIYNILWENKDNVLVGLFISKAILSNKMILFRSWWKNDGVSEEQQK